MHALPCLRSSALTALVSAGLALVAASVARAADGTWAVDADGLWSETTNWQGGVVASGSGSTAFFNAVDITADRAVQLDADYTLTNLVFGDSGSDPDSNWTLGNNGLSTNNLILAGTTPTITVESATTTIQAVIEGGGLTKLGAGTLTLSGTNTYSGSTFIAAGTLALSGGNNRLPTTTRLDFTGTSGTLDVGSNSQSIAALTVPNGLAASYAVTGAGTLAIGSGLTALEIGPGGTIASGSGNLVTLDLSGLGNFTYTNAGPGTVFRVGLKLGAGDSAVLGQVATATLAASNTITTSLIGVGDISAGRSGGSSTLRLGEATSLNASTINVGYSGRSNATLEFASGLTNPALTIRGIDGTSALPEWLVGNVANFNETGGNTWNANVNLSGGIVDAVVTEMFLGNAVIGSSGSRAGTQNATLTMGSGTLAVGTLTIGRIDGTGSVSNTLAANGTLTIGTAGGQVVADSILLARNTYTGGTGFTRSVSGTINLTAGTLAATSIARGPQTGNATATTAFNWTGGTLTHKADTDLLVASVPIALGSGTGTFHATASRTITVDAASPISGGGGLTKTGPGTLLLAAANSYTGETTISDGTLVLANALALQNSRLDTSGAGTVNLGNGVTAATLGGLAGATNLASVITTGYGNLTALTLNPASGITATYSGLIADGAAGMTLTKTGAGTQALTGANTYTGPTTISAGTLQVGSGGSTGSLGSGAVMNDASLVFDRSGSLTVANAISGSGSLTKSGSGEVVLSGANSYAGTTTLTAGTLRVGNGTSGSLASTPVTFSGPGRLSLEQAPDTAQSLGALTFSAGGGTVASVYPGSGTTSVTFGSLAARAAGATGNFVVTGGTNGSTNSIVLTGATANALLGPGYFFDGSNYAWYDTAGYVRAITASDAGFVTAPAGATFGTVDSASNVNVTGGITAQPTATVNTVRLADAVAANNAVTVTTGNTLALAGILKAGGNAGTIGGGTLTAATAGGELVVRSDAATDAVTISSVITDNASASRLTTTGGGRVILTGTNTYSGTTTIASGTLQVGDGGAAGSLGTAAVVNDGLLVFNRSDSVDISLAISGTGGLTKEGSGTVNLIGTRTYTGVTTVNQGRLIARRNGGVGAPLGPSVITGSGRLDLGAFGASFSSSQPFTLQGTGTPTLTAFQGTVNFNGPISLDGTGTFRLLTDAANISTSDMRINGGVTRTGAAGGTLRLQISGTSGSTTASRITVNSTLANNAGPVEVLGSNRGTVVFNTVGHDIGGLTINGTSGSNSSLTTVQLGVSDALALTQPLTITRGAFDLAGFSQTIGGLSGSATAGHATITNSGATASVLTVGNGVGSGSYGGVIADGATGTVSLVKTGAGTQTLTGTNTFSGPTTISAGTLALGSGGGLASAAIDVAAGARFDVSALAGAFAVGSGQELRGAGTILGSLLFGADSKLAFASSLAVDSGTVSFSGFGIDDIVGLDGTLVNEGTYTLLGGTATFDLSGALNVGFANRADIGGGKDAYFNQGSLQVIVVPEPEGLALLGMGVVVIGAGLAGRGRKAPASA